MVGLVILKSSTKLEAWEHLLRIIKVPKDMCNIVDEIHTDVPIKELIKIFN